MELNIFLWFVEVVKKVSAEQQCVMFISWITVRNQGYLHGVCDNTDYVLIQYCKSYHLY